MQLNLGCGKDRLEGWINVDIAHECDVIHDLNVFPYPWEDESVSYIKMHHVLEHLDKPLDVLIECSRILRKGGILDIEVPYGVTTLTHPFHKHDFLPEWFRTLTTHDTKSMIPHRNKVSLWLRSLRIKRGDNAFWRKYEIIVKMVKI